MTGEAGSEEDAIPVPPGLEWHQLEIGARLVPAREMIPDLVYPARDRRVWVLANGLVFGVLVPEPQLLSPLAGIVRMP
jgi:hypothetical protein